MKSMMLAGVALMVGAGIYGFANYEKTRNKKEFKEMYKSPAAVVVNENKPVKEVPAPAVVEEKKMSTVSTVSSEKPKEKNKKAATKKVKKQRKIRREFFSRGGLDDRFIEEADTLPKPKVIKDLQ